MENSLLYKHDESEWLEPILNTKDKAFKGEKYPLRMIRFFHDNKPSSSIAWDVIKLAMSEKLPDYPAIFWKPFVESIGGENDCHYVKLKGSDKFFCDSPFSDNANKFSSKEICTSLEDTNNVVYVSYIYLNNKLESSNSIFKLEKLDGFFRVTEYDARKTMLIGKPCSIVQTFYIKSRDCTELFIDLVLENSLGVDDNEEKKYSSPDIFKNNKFHFLEKGHSSVGNPISNNSSGISALLLAGNMVSADFVGQLNNMDGMYDFISSDQNKQYVSIKEMVRKVRLDISTKSCKLVKENNKCMLYPGTISSGIDVREMVNYPIVQGADPRLPHPVFKQPHRIVSITHGNHYKSISREQLDEVVKNINKRLQDANFHHEFERDNYSYGEITKDNIKDGLYDFTLGINGITAKNTIPMLTPIIYKHQYTELGSDEHMAIISAIKNYLGVYLNFHNKEKRNLEEQMEVEKEMFAEAERLRQNYSWTLPPYKLADKDSSREVKLWCNGWGAGGISAGINGDSSEDRKYVNHASITCETVDKDGNPSPPIVVYFSLREIEKGEELLVNYGNRYRFTKPHKGYIAPVITTH